MDFSQTTETITDFIITEVKKRNSNGIVIGLSGGLDSAVAVYLAVKALGPEKILGLILPDSKVSTKKDTDDAKKIADLLGIKYKVIDIAKAKKDLQALLPKNKMAQSNLSARLRMSIIYYFASVLGRLVLGTSDKSEVMMGYFTKYGDGAADILPIADLYKTEVRALAKYLGIGFGILDKKSSPGLWKGQTAEGEIGMLYKDIDSILMVLERGLNKNGIEWLKSSIIIELIVSQTGIDKKKVSKIIDTVQRNLHKQELPPVCKIDHK